MSITISLVTDNDLKAVDNLMKINSGTLGFLPRQALADHIRRKWVLGAKTDDEKLVGYLLFASYDAYIRIVHLCVAQDYRGQGVARSLMDRLKSTVTTQKRIELRCRRDFQENNMWPKFGFVPLDEKAGRSLAGHLLTAWCFTLRPDDQLTLFQAQVTDHRLDVIIDAQVFFDIDEPDTDKAMPSKALTSDFMIDSVRLNITDEIFTEIDRNDDPIQRKRSRDRAKLFPIVSTNNERVEEYVSILRQHFPQASRPSDESDIRHLAKAAASDVNIFVTRDSKLLERFGELRAVIQLQVMTPTDIILKLHEFSAQRMYTPNPVSGPTLGWRRLSSGDLQSVSFQPFLLHGERQGAFATRLGSLIAVDPDNCWCEILWADQAALALRVLRRTLDSELNVQLARVAPSPTRGLIERFTISDAIEKAVALNLDVVRIRCEGLSPVLKSYMHELGFITDGDDFVRYCFSRCLDVALTLASISNHTPQSSAVYRGVSALEFQRMCSPLCLTEIEQNYFLVPIRPGYALSMVDRRRSAEDMFGGDPNVLLRWENVYYKSKSHQRMLRSPARILWYVSGDEGRVVAVSHLDEVEVGRPKTLFRRFEKFGILGWNEIYEMCGREPSREIMALKFSNTFSFREPISLESLQRASDSVQHSLVLQSPSRIPSSLFERIFSLGYND